MSEHGEGGGGVLRELLALFSFGVDEEGLKHGEARLEEFQKKVTHVVEGVMAAFAVDAIMGFAESNVKAMTEIEHAASRLSISTDEVQAYQFAAKALGMESEQLLNSMGRLQVTQQAAAGGNKQAAEAFAAIGVKVKDSNGHFKEADQLFMDVADGIADTKDASKQAALAVHFFGRQGRELLPILKKGSDGLDELIEEYHQLGGGYTEDAIEQSKKFEHQSARLGLVWKGLKSTIMNFLLPPLTWLIGKFAVAVGWFRNLNDSTRLLQIGFAALGAVIVAWAAPMLLAAAPILLLVAGLTALALIVNSIIRMFEGKQSAIGDMIDKLFGEGSSTELVKTLKDTWDSVSSSISTAWGYLKEFYNTLKPIGETMANIMASMLTIGDKIRESSAALGILGNKGLSKIATGDVRGAVSDAVNQIALDASIAAAGAGGYAPPPMLAAGVAQNNVEVNVNVPPGLNEQQVGEHVANQVHRVLKQKHREAANTRRRAPNP